MVFLPHWPKPIGYQKQVKNLQIVQQALSYLGTPQNKLNNIIHIAGTNGKGSTLAFIKQILIANGYKINCFTSPYLLNFNEQYIVKNQIISDIELKNYLEEVRVKIENKYNLSYFQSTAIAGFYIFSKNSADFNLIETGMGGRIDPTNVFTHKLMSILSPISYDHTEYLGTNLIQITCEKADIIKNSDHIIIAKQKPIVKACLKIICQKEQIENVKFFKESYDFDADENNFFQINIDEEKIESYSKPNLVGCHQQINLATALAAISEISSKFSIDVNNTNLGIEKTRWPGRLEKINIAKNFLKNAKSEIIFDGAHNDNGARFLALWVKQNSFNGETILIYGRTSGKDHKTFLQKFKNVVSRFSAIEVQSEASPARINEIKNNIKDAELNCDYHNDLYDAIANEKNNNQPVRMIICGSLFLYRDIKHFF